MDMSVLFRILHSQSISPLDEKAKCLQFIQGSTYLCIFVNENDCNETCRLSIIITNMTCQLDLPMTAVTFLFSSLSSLATPSGGVDFGT